MFFGNLSIFCWKSVFATQFGGFRIHITYSRHYCSVQRKKVHWKRVLHLCKVEWLISDGDQWISVMKTEDLIQYYYVNKVAFNRPQNSGWLCSTCSSLYVLYGQALNMFLVLYDSTFSHFWTKNHKYSFETRFTECVGTEVFGIHTVVNFRQIYDEKMKSSVMQEVKHPDTIYVLPDLPYSYRMDNATTAEMEKMRPKLQKMDLNYLWFYNCLICCLHIRVLFELIVVLFFTVLFIFLVSKCEQAYTCIMLQPIRRRV